MDTDKINKLTREVIGAAMAVSNALGIGFLEAVYHRALLHELRKRGLRVNFEQPIKVYYDDMVVGEYKADLVIENTVLVELKHVESLASEHVAQCLNYLKATRLPVCLLLNFGKSRLEIRRLVR